MRTIAIALLLVGCGDDSTPETDAGTTAPDSGPSAADAGDPGAPPTWYGDVAHIAYARCTGCHTTGGIAPFELLSYESAMTQALRIKDAVMTRRMPPWLADDSGECNHFVTSRWLSEAEIATIVAWVDASTPMGDPADGPTMPAPVPALEGATHTWDPGATYTPNASLTDDYRCFLIDPNLDSSMYVTAFQVMPGDQRVVHHVIVYSLDSASARDGARARDAEDATLGFTCFGDPGDRLLAGWAPGTPPTVYPEGTGIEIGPDTLLSMQVHYNLAAGAIPDRTTVDVRLASSVPRPADVYPLAHTGMRVEPRMEYQEVSLDISNPAPIPVTVFGVYPHMHTLGRTLRVTRTAAGATQCLVDVPRWDFNWQQFYFYDEPIVLEPGDVLNITCGYDTRSRSDAVTWGEGTSDEMCLNFLYASLGG